MQYFAVNNGVTINLKTKQNQNGDKIIWKQLEKCNKHSLIPRSSWKSWFQGA
jgi:hypothetical protein